MKTWMKATLTASMIAAGCIGASGAFAHDGKSHDGPRTEARWHKVSAEEMQARMAERHERRMAKLEQALQLTDEQRDNWSTFTEELAKRHERTVEKIQARAEDGKPKTAIERLARMEKHAKRMQEETAETRKAVERFYPTLSDAQKATFDEEFANFRHKGHKGHHRHHHHDKSGEKGEKMEQPTAQKS